MTHRPAFLALAPWLLIAAWIVNALFHVPSFSRSTFTGDEYVYLTLAQEMSWSLGHYTTADNPDFADWPITIYQQPLFHHGPVLPLVIKLGGLVGQPVAAALLFANIAMAIFFLHLLLLCRRLAIADYWRDLTLVFVAVAPLLMFSTTRIHLDAITGIFIACACIAYIEAVERKSACWSLWCGSLFALALNLKFTALICLPLIVMLGMYGLYRARLQPGFEQNTPAEHYQRLRRTHLKTAIIVAGLVATIGLQHFYRLYFTYGSILPWDIYQGDLDSYWYQWLATRSRRNNLINLVLLVPLLIILITPVSWRATKRDLQVGDWGVVFTLGFVYLAAVLFIFSYSELRYFALAMPMFYCALPGLLKSHKRAQSPAVLALAAVSLVAMAAVSYREVVIRPDEVFKIVPLLYELVPGLARHW